IAPENPTPEPLPLLFSSLPLRRRRRLALLSSPPHFSPLRRPCRRQPSQPCDRASPSSSLHTAGEHGPARPHPSTAICTPLSSHSARLPIIIELGIEACCNCFLPICVECAHDAVTRPIQLEAVAGVVHPLSSRRDAAFFRCSERHNEQHRHTAAAAVSRLAGRLRELLCHRCANEQSKEKECTTLVS
uniref:Uncharacterized protein n=1 Tax=Oryza meridionalis TaxID=40149 RepID=A0A0E0E303_9ORYZ